MLRRCSNCIVSVCVVLVLFLFSLTGTEQAADLKRLNLDDPMSLGTTIAADKDTKSQGSGSIRISTLWPTTICLGELSDLDVENATLVYRANVKSEKLEGQAFLEMWCHFGGGQYFSRGLNSVIAGTSDWKTLETPFFLQKGQKPEKVTLNIVVNGKGTVWINEARLVKEPLK